MIAEIIGPSGKVHYRRPENDPLVDEARKTPGYSVRLVETREEKNDREIAAGIRCSGLCNDGRPCNC